MTSRILDSFAIKGFRTFEKLRIDHLGLVNLIVGKNGVGKSAILEALMLYASQGHPTIMVQLLESRYEATAYRATSYIREEKPNIEEIIQDIRFLFFGRPELKEQLGEFDINIGPIEPLSKKLSVKLQWYDQLEKKELPNRQQLLLLKEGDYEQLDETHLGIRISFGGETYDHPLDRIFRRVVYPSTESHIRFQFISASGLSLEEMAKYWDAIALTEFEQEVILASQMIVPGIEGISFIATNSRLRSRIPIARLKGLRVPFHSLGEGSVRLLGLALAISKAKDGMLLVDEIESGLHYSVHPHLWRFIFRLAEQLNVQVFATTHSDDCVKAFQYAATENEQVEGQLIRLERWNDQHIAVILDERQLEIAVTQNIETR
jgi:ABC-type dipeptide/oligopeptide/nickel transport system ATPase subunit